MSPASSYAGSGNSVGEGGKPSSKVVSYASVARPPPSRRGSSRAGGIVPARPILCRDEGFCYHLTAQPGVVREKCFDGTGGSQPGRDAADLSAHLDARRGILSVWKQLANQWALVTGASAGLGAEFARQLASHGMHLILVARRGELMEALAAELLTQHGTRCHVIPADLSEPGEPQRILTEIAAQGLTVELLVNNAGFGIVGEVDGADVDLVLEMLRLNVSALTELTYRLLPGMLERGHGAILNVASLSAFQPVAYMGAYAASKTFVLHFSESLHCELKDRGITVTAVCPGVTRTSFFDIAGAPGWLQKHAALDVDYVVKRALKALARRRQYDVPGWRNYLLTLLVRIASRRRVVKESTRFFRPKRPPKSDK